MPGTALEPGDSRSASVGREAADAPRGEMVRMVTIETVHGPLPTARADEVRALAATARDGDGIAPLSEQPLLNLQADAADQVVHLLAVAEAAHPAGLLGYAQLDLGAADQVGAELVVAPSARRRGIGSGLLARAQAVAAGGPTGPTHPAGTTDPGVARSTPARPLAVWAHGDLPPARAFAAARGLVVVRELWQMRLDLGPGSHPASLADLPPLPDGVTVRPFVPGRDEDAWLAVNARAFAHHPEQGRMTRADLDAREREPWFDPAGLLLAERDGRLLGFGWTKVHPSVDPDEPGPGEIYALGIDPDAQGLGLGRALTALDLAHLAGRGVRTVILYTEGDNTVAIRTYTRAGFVRSAVDVMYGPPVVPPEFPAVSTGDTHGSSASGTMGR
ncbi:mycothiol acetyltransferase [Actinomycetota bacterium]|nr:mycothiol acetyltransferase [Actinomycetota bacterium]